MAKNEYTKEDKARAAEAYVRKGGYSAASRETGIPRKTISDWAKQDEVFQEFEKRTWDAYMGELATFHADLCTRATAAAAERIEQGDPIVQNGEVVGYRPVSARDATWIAGVMYDKARIGLALPGSYGKSDTGVHEGLKKLHEALEQVGRTEPQHPPHKKPEPAEAHVH